MMDVFAYLGKESTMREFLRMDGTTIYEAPAVSEVGTFQETTQGWPTGWWAEGPFSYFY